jgi:hypothetical protein
MMNKKASHHVNVTISYFFTIKNKEALVSFRFVLRLCPPCNEKKNTIIIFLVVEGIPRIIVYVVIL